MRAARCDTHVIQQQALVENDHIKKRRQSTAATITRNSRNGKSGKYHTFLREQGSNTRGREMHFGENLGVMDYSEMEEGLGANGRGHPAEHRQLAKDTLQVIKSSDTHS